MSTIRYTVNETCSCGAAFNFDEQMNYPSYSIMDEQHEKFLKAHETCRTPAVISNGMELKMFLSRKPIMIEEKS